MTGARWPRLRLKFVSARPICNGVGEPSDHAEPSWPRYVRITDIAGPRALREDTFRSLPPELAAGAPLDVGDVLVAAVGATFGKAYLHEHDIGPACFAGYLVRVRPNALVRPAMLAYWMESQDYWDQVRTAVVQATVQNFSAEKVRQLRMPLPPVDMQRAIAAFLDRKTAEIDALIAKKGRLLELLEEKRAALITQAVTKGITPGVEMKEVPLMRLVPDERPIMYGIVLPGPNVDDGVTIVKGGDVAPGRLRLDLLDRTTLEIESRYVRSRLRGGDLVYAIRGSIGSVEVVPPELEGANLTQDAARIARRPGVLNRWLLYALRSRAVFSQLDAKATGATIRGINIRDLKRVSIPVPSDAEQRRIADFLDDSVNEFDVLSSRVRHAIALLREYRTTVITAAVTGQIAVSSHEA